MKRCPECLFLYPDSDEHCDFDKTPLEVIDDSALEAATRPANRRSLPIAAAIGLIVGVLAFATYYAVSYKTRNATAATETTQSAPRFCLLLSSLLHPRRRVHHRLHRHLPHRQRLLRTAFQPLTRAPRAIRFQRVDQEWEPGRVANP